MISSLRAHICTYMCMNAYKMYKLPEVVKAASSSTSFKEEEREQSRFISNVRIMKQVIQ